MRGGASAAGAGARPARGAPRAGLGSHRLRREGLGARVHPTPSRSIDCLTLSCHYQRNKKYHIYLPHLLGLSRDRRLSFILSCYNYGLNMKIPENHSVEALGKPPVFHPGDFPPSLSLPLSFLFSLSPAPGFTPRATKSLSRSPPPHAHQSAIFGCVFFIGNKRT